MIDFGKYNLLGIGIDAVDYEAALARILAAARERRAYTVSAMAVHGVMTGAQDAEQAYRLNALDLVVPDGQPVRWALRWLHGVRLPDRVYGPTLTLKVCEAAAREGLPIFLYGSTPEVLTRLVSNLTARFPTLRIAGSQPSLFRRTTESEAQTVAETIRGSGAALVLVGLGCPRQETWAYEYRDALPMPLLAVGAAFDFHAGTLPQAPAWMQRAGLEWLFRMVQEPKRLWRRYAILNPLFLWSVFLQATRLRRFPPAATPPRGAMYFG